MDGIRVSGGDGGWAPGQAREWSGGSLALGRYPSPVFRAGPLELDRGELWVKDDGVLNEVYGGNKVRKLERILDDAAAGGATRVLTVGAAGSHHVLATTLFARQLGLPAVAVLTPQPWTEHAEATLRASLRAGLEAHPARGISRVPLALARIRRRGDALIPIGGSSVCGVMGYHHAALELQAQIEAGELPTPDVIVTAVGSGGTAAGLLAGCVSTGLPCTVLGVSVATGRRVSRALVLWLARAAARRGGASTSWRRLSQSLRVEDGELGPGYGYPTRSGAVATEIARRTGLVLDPTYTAKAFAGALRLLGSRELPEPPLDSSQLAEMTDHFKNPGPLRVLYWHTLSAVPLEAVAQASSTMNSLPTALSELLHTQ